jgi:1-deoxy-D-xylulose-5-phosphate synthase
VSLAARHRLTVTVEDAVATGGFGSRLSEACSVAGVSTPVLPLGLPTAFLPHAERSQLLAQHGLDGAGIHAAVTRRLAAHPAPAAISRRAL